MHPDEIKRIYSLYKGYDHDLFPRTRLGSSAAQSVYP